MQAETPQMETPLDKIMAGTLVYFHPAGNKISEKPDNTDNQNGLYQSHCARFHDIAEQYSRAQTYYADFDEKLALDSRFHPVGNIKDIPDNQS